jgi:hypothetical protein
MQLVRATNIRLQANAIKTGRLREAALEDALRLDRYGKRKC